MIQEIKVRFDSALREKFSQKADVLNFLLKHERKNLCITNIAEQILRAENYNINISIKTYDKIIKDIALMFARAVIEHVEQQHMSAIKKAQIRAKEDAIKNAELMLKDLEKDSVNEKGLTEIERDLLRHEVKKRAEESRRQADKVQA